MIIGNDIVLNIMASCTRCVMITLPQGTVAKYNEVHVGVHASVEHGGTIHRGVPYNRKKDKNLVPNFLIRLFFCLTDFQNSSSFM